jgi:hypothetical protein
VNVDRHLAGLATVGATLPLLAAWLMTANPNCGPGGGAATACYAWGLPRVWAWTAFAVPAGAVAGVLGLLVPPAWVERAAGDPVAALLFAPRDAALVALGPVVAGAALLAPPLFFGSVTSRATVWGFIAVPYLPFLAVTAALLALQGLVAGWVTTAAVALAWVLTAVAQAVWFAAIASALAVGYETASERNSASE